MSTEPIDIVVTDKVPDSVQNKFLNIASAALAAFDAIYKVQEQLNKFSNVDGINKLISAQNNLSKISAQSQLDQERLAVATANTAAAQARAATASTNTSTATQRLAIASANAATAQVRGQTAASQAATAQQRLSVATAQASAAQNRAAISALQLQNAQSRLAGQTHSVNDTLAEFAKNSLAAFGFTAGIRNIIELGDAYTSLQNKLQNVTSSQEQVNELTNRLFDLANRTRAPIEATTTAFTRFDRSLKSLGKSQEDSLRLTETVNKALIISGSSSGEASSALLQLSQAFNSGKLQGDEFRSISENLPIVLDAIAKATNTPINQVKKLASEGKITSEVLFNAFKILEQQVDSTFAKTIPTVSQAFTVLKNNVEKAFGEFNKSVGFTENLAKGVLFLANNIKLLELAASTVGGVLLLAFGPRLITAILAFNKAVLANPLVFFATVVFTVLKALYIFKDDIKVFGDGITTLGDVFTTVFTGIKNFVVDTYNSIKELFSGNFLSDETKNDLDKVLEAFKTAYDFLITLSKITLNFVVGLFIALGKSIGVVAADFPAAFEATWKNIVNGAITAVEKIINSFVEGLKTISGLLENIAPDLSKSLNAALDNVKVQLPRVELSENAKNVGEEVGKIFGEAFSKDYVGEVKNAIKQTGQNRIAVGASVVAPVALRGSGPNTTVPDADKGALKRSTYLEKINGELDKQIRNFGQLAEVRVVNEKLDQIDIDLASKRLAKLSETEKADIRFKLETVESNKRVQAAQDAVFQDTFGSFDRYIDLLKGTDNLLKQNAISEQQASEARKKAIFEYEQANDPLFAFNKSIRDQTDLLGLNDRERQIQATIQQINNTLAAKGQSLTLEQTKSIRDQLTVLQNKEDVDKALQQLYNQNIESQRKLTIQQEALTQAYEKGYIGQQQYKIGLLDIQAAASDLNITRGLGTLDDSVTSIFARLRAGFKGVTEDGTKAFGDFFVSVEDGAANSIGKAIVGTESFGDAIRSVAQDALGSLISALVKIGIQYLITEAFGIQSTTSAVTGSAVEAAAFTAATIEKTAAAVTALTTITTANALAGEATALAWAPAAAAVSLASFGANSIPAIAGITEAFTLSSVLAAIPGFSEGGFTGSTTFGGGIAGVVHPNEFVNDAASTTRNRPILEAMNDGATFGVASGQKTNLNVSIENYGVSKEFEVQQISEERITIIARDVAKSTVASDTPKLIASHIANPNSDVSKSISRNTTAQRSRGG